MARKSKKKKAALSSMLKYEIYGIILVTLSVIALSGEAAVGRSLSKMSALMLGKFYFVIPLIGIYLGLAVMISRKWPTRWTTRRSGVLIGVLALTLMSTISAMQHKLLSDVPLTTGNIMSLIHQSLQKSLFHTAASQGDSGFSMLNLDISGGYIGGLEFVLLYSLFGMAGAKLIMIVLLAISFMLITGLSYVDLFRMLRTKTGQLSKLLHKKMNRLRPVVPANNSVKSKVKERPIPIVEDDLDAVDDEISVFDDNQRSAQNVKKPVFFQLFNYKSRTKDSENSEPALNDPPIEDLKDESQSESESLPVINWNELDYRAKSEQVDQQKGPIIRDFFDQIQRETIHQHADSSELHEPVNEAVPGILTNTSADTEPAHIDLGNEAEFDSIEEPSYGSHANADLQEEAPLQQAAPKPAPKPSKPYQLPPFRLLSRPGGTGKAGDQADYMQTARKLEATLESFGVRARVLEVVRGPAVTRYEIQPDIGVKVSRIVNLTDDIALALAAKDIRMEAPIPGKSAIGIEVPNNEVSVVTMREVMETPTFMDSESKLSIAFGRDISGQTIVGNLAKMPHLLVAGATGSGKSVCINGIIASILYKAKPDEVKFLMVDPKMVELNVYNGIPHLLAPVVTDPRRASLALKKIVVEMEKRYELFSKSGTRNVEGYNAMMKDHNPDAVLPYIVVVVDELADLMMVAAGDVEDAIARLAQMARAAGIHLIIATQRPSVDVITGVIKANIPSRIAFGVSSQVDSRTILDMAGAEKLLGRGDMLFMPMGASKPIRVQGAFMSDQEVETIVNYVRDQGQAEYDESLVPEVDDEIHDQEEVLDELYDQAVQIVLEAKQASVSLLQRRMRVGYTRAARLIDSMEARGIVGPYEGSKPREVLMSIDQYKMGRISS